MRRFLTHHARIVGTVAARERFDARGRLRCDRRRMRRPGRRARRRATRPSAAALHGWGEPNRVEEFDGAARRRTGTSTTAPATPATGAAPRTAVERRRRHPDDHRRPGRATPAGMAMEPRAEVRPLGGPGAGARERRDLQRAAAALAGRRGLPVGGEIDFMEMIDHTRQTHQHLPALRRGQRPGQRRGRRSTARSGTTGRSSGRPTHDRRLSSTGKEWWRTDRHRDPPARRRCTCASSWTGSPGTGRARCRSRRCRSTG